MSGKTVLLVAALFPAKGQVDYKKRAGSVENSHDGMTGGLCCRIRGSRGWPGRSLKVKNRDKSGFRKLSI
ncbi:MAG: hypothetical protein HN580_13050 [Deltaproteobacteria bacterium]|nr:hypothetical protein [Deltaproteobacteria bacterium]MBT4264402.1 hypothetical protein [Deltaproteobacteria bacterium]MBT4643065.1 hypothetical protein [Deltaproteobacteria bacterium]MBT6613979.1 hypothetical protein [Deltaproteobacteria bacterium]MBT7889945.1 hypothetical protein [Deltaproteobacteria bacterium]